MSKKKIGYRAIHYWVEKKLGKPRMCEDCGNNGLERRKYHWANKNHKYKKNLRDWKRLCSGCHIRYDVKNIKTRKGTLSVGDEIITELARLGSTKRIRVKGVVKEVLNTFRGVSFYLVTNARVDSDFITKKVFKK